jgi:hypothetical protein
VYACYVLNAVAGVCVEYAPNKWSSERADERYVGRVGCAVCRTVPHMKHGVAPSRFVCVGNIFISFLLQGTLDSTGGVLSVVKQITSEGTVLNLFNYGLLTAAHAVPGFFSFVAMR